MASPLKIAYLYQSSHVDFSEPFAVQLHIYHQVHGLQQRGHHVDLLGLHKRQVICTNDLKVFKQPELEAKDFGKLGLSGTKFFKFIESALRRLQRELKLPYLSLFDSYRLYDACRQNLKSHNLIHERYNLLAFGGAWASLRLGIPYVLEVNADLLEEREAQGTKERGLRRLFAILTTRFSFRQAQRIICVSSQLKEHLIQKWKLDESKLVVMPNAADTEAFGKPVDVGAIRAKLGLQDEPVVMFVGGFYLWHDLELLVTSFAQVIEQVPNAKLLLIGDGRTKSKIEEVVATNGLAHAVMMVGPVAHHLVPEMLAIAAIAVAPNISFFGGHGGSPLKIFEYMAAGKAIVATRTGQIAEIIQDGHNGRLVEAGDGAKFAEAITNLLTNPALRDKLGQQARQQAVEQHSWKQYSWQLEKIYSALI